MADNPYSFLYVDPPNLGLLPPGVNQLTPEENPAGGNANPEPVNTFVRNGVRYVELRGSPRGHWTPTHSDITRDLLCLWTDPAVGSMDAIKNLIGFPVVKQANGGEFLSRLVPDSAPILSLNDGFRIPRPYIWATTVRETEGFVPNHTTNIDFAGWHTYKYVKLTVVYEVLPWFILTDEEMIDAGYVDNNGNPDDSYLVRGVKIQPNPEARIQTLPQNSMIFVSDGSVVKATNGRYEIDASVEITWYEVPEAAVGARLANPFMADQVGGVPYTDPITQCLGCVNTKTFAGNPKGTMLLSAVILEPHTSILGQRLFTVRYRFRYFPGASTPTYTAGGVANQQVRGHVLILRPDAPPTVLGGGPTIPTIGYDEAIVKTAPQSSNALLDPPAQGVNLVNWADMDQLFRVPALKRDNP